MNRDMRAVYFKRDTIPVAVCIYFIGVRHAMPCKLEVCLFLFFCVLFSFASFVCWAQSARCFVADIIGWLNESN